MKRNTSLLIALGLVSSTAFAQTEAPMPSPDSVESQSGSSAQEPIAPDPQYESQSGTSSGTSSSQSPGMSSAPSSGAHPQASHQSSSAAGESPERQEMLARLQPQTNQEGVSYICGGVGKEEARYMRQQAKNHDLMLQFAARNGEFLAGVNVQIANPQGKQVLQTTCDGPMMLVDFPKGGAYKVHADASGYVQNQTINVAARQKGQVAAVVLAWPQRVAQLPASSTETQTGGSQTGGSQSSGGGQSGGSQSSGSGTSGENSKHGMW